MASPTALTRRLAVVLLAALASGCAAPHGGDGADRLDPALADLRWLVGTWRAGDPSQDAPGPVQVEHWQVHDDGSLIAANYQLVGGEVVPHQNLALVADGRGGARLEVTGYELTGDRAVPFPMPSYRVAELGPDFVRFEAPGGVVPRAILYQRLDADRLLISIVLPVGESENEYFVTFVRAD